MNNINIIGNLTKDPTLKFTKTGKAIATFTVAVQKNFKKEEANFLPCQVWGATAEKYIAEYAKKGTKVAVSGELNIDTWKDDEGQFKSKTYINVDRVEILSSKSNDDSKESLEEADIFEELDDTGDDIPFRR